jgi:hypothetical protein
MILNRAGDVPSDGWYQIEVTGKHPAGKKRKQVIDRTALESIVNRFDAEKNAAGENFAGMLVDLDHLSHDLDNTTEAYAWLQEVQIRNNELFGRLDLSDLGETAIRNKRVKFFSTEYDPEDLEDLGNGEVRPLRLSGLAFTNRPNNRGGKPISNRDGDQPGGEQTETKPTMQPIALKLGLPADADEAAILKKLADIMSELEALKGKDAEVEAEAIMNRLGKRIPDAVKPLWKAKLIANRKETEELMEASFPVNPKREAAEKIFNRETAKQPDTVSDDEGGKVEATKTAAAIRNRANTIAREQNIPFNRAFGLAQAELS